MADRPGKDSPGKDSPGKDIEADDHTPVLLPRCLQLLHPALVSRPATLVDATVGLGGHSAALLAAHPQLTLVGLDRDPQALEIAAARLAPHRDRIHLIAAVYDELPAVLARLGISTVDGVLFDLGVSSLQLDNAQRGFSYARDAALDMRMDPAGSRTAADVVNDYPEAELRQILREYGEERFAGRIAAAIVAGRARQRLDRTAQLVELIYRAIPAAARRQGGHPAKRTFQALRIEVNDELTALRSALPSALAALVVGGRLVALSYHSLEDRIVKRALAAVTTSRSPLGLPVELPGHGPEFRSLTRGAEQASAAEVTSNPRAASVRLRAVERIVSAAQQRSRRPEVTS